MFSLVDGMQFLKQLLFNFGVGILSPLYLCIILFIYIFYKKNIMFEEYTFGESKSHIGDLVFESSMYGILIGFIISFIINILGIHVRVDYNFLWIWLIVLLLVSLNFKYLVFSYAVSIFAVVSLIIGKPDVDISGLLALVALLHLAEAFLIMSQGYKNAVPIYVNHKGKVVGAFSMQRFWPIPVVILILNIILKNEMPSQIVNVSNPSWWPIMKNPNILNSQTLLLGMLPIPAVLGYSKITVTNSPRKEALKSGIGLCIYSIILLTLAVLSTYFNIVKYIAAVFTAVGHEILIVYRNYKQKNKDAYFSVPKRGVRVLDTIPDGPAEEMGIMPGDIILSINNKDIMTEQGIYAALEDYPSFIWVDVLRENSIINLEYMNYKDGISDLRIMTVPRSQSVANVINPPDNAGVFFRILSLMKRQLKNLTNKG